MEVTAGNTFDGLLAYPVGNGLQRLGFDHPKLDAGIGRSSLGVSVCHGFNLLVVINCQLVNFFNSFKLDQARLRLGIPDTTYM